MSELELRRLRYNYLTSLAVAYVDPTGAQVLEVVKVRRKGKENGRSVA